MNRLQSARVQTKNLHMCSIRQADLADCTRLQSAVGGVHSLHSLASCTFPRPMGADKPKAKAKPHVAAFSKAKNKARKPPMSPEAESKVFLTLASFPSHTDNAAADLSLPLPLPPDVEHLRSRPIGSPASRTSGTSGTSGSSGSSLATGASKTPTKLRREGSPHPKRMVSKPLSDLQLVKMAQQQQQRRPSASSVAPPPDSPRKMPRGKRAGLAYADMFTQQAAMPFFAAEAADEAMTRMLGLAGMRHTPCGQPLLDEAAFLATAPSAAPVL